MSAPSPKRVALYPHPKLPGIFATRDGRVFREFLSSPHNQRYDCLSITVGTNTRLINRHVVVTETFHGPRPRGQVARHLDGNPRNNTADNLAWGTRIEDRADMIVHGTANRGTRHPSNRLTETEVFAIQQRRAAGESEVVLAEEFNVSKGAIAAIHHGRNWGWLTGKGDTR